MQILVGEHHAYAYTGGKVFDANLPTVVFIHGAANDHSNFNLLARWFAHHGHSVLAVDLPGHMRSGGPALHSIEAMAQWLLAFLRAAGVTRASLVGHSMGSLVALEAAASSHAMANASPDSARVPLGAGAGAGATTIDRLVMMGTCLPMTVPQALLDLGRSDVAAAIDRVVQFSFSTLAAKPSFPGPGTWLRGASRSLMCMVTARGPGNADGMLFHTDFQACHGYQAGLQAAARVACRASLILGANDQMTPPKAARALAEALRAEVHTVPAGHFLMSEAPHETLTSLRQALS
jgi:pimeloyl-ACP methyl ester carboxylesterase